MKLKKEINTNHINIQFHKEMLNIRNWLTSNFQNSFHYSKEVFIDRLVQYFACISLPVYSKKIKKLSNDSLSSLPAEGSILNIEVACLELGTGKVFIPLISKVRNLGVFFKHWFACLLAIIFFKKSNNSANAVLVYGVSAESIIIKNTDDQFVNYCQKSKITPLKTTNNLFIEFRANQKLINHDNFYYCKYPIINAIRNINLGPSVRLRVLINHIILIFQYLVAIIRSPQILLLSKEIAYVSIVTDLDRSKKLEAIVFTCSNYIEQPMWSRELINSAVHMIWYAQAWRPNTYKVDKLESFGPNLPLIKADSHWVWTNKFAEYLTSLGLQAKFEVVGSIMWYFPILKKKNSSHIHITVFDISPYSDEVALDYGQIKNFNNPTNLNAFIDDILSVANRLEKILNISIKLSLKQKRLFKSVYDKDYYLKLEKLSAKGVISLVQPKDNIYGLISSSDIVIAYPFTSTLYIADELKVPSIFYDPTGLICRHDFSGSQSLIDFVSSKEILYESISNLIKYN